MEIIEILVKPGTVEAEDPPPGRSKQYDKASPQIPAQAGVIAEVSSRSAAVNQDLILKPQGRFARPRGAAPEESRRLPLNRPRSPHPRPSGRQRPRTDRRGGGARCVLPDIGDFRMFQVIEMLVNVGDSVEAEQSLLTLESIASMEIPSPLRASSDRWPSRSATGSTEVILIASLESAGAAPPVMQPLRR